MATPHVAGVYALALEGQPIYKTKAEVDNLYTLIRDTATTDKVIFDGVWEGQAARFADKIAYSLLEKEEAVNDVAEPVVPAPVITPPVIAPSPVPVAPLPIPPSPPKKESGNKSLIFIGIGAVIVIGVIIALAV